MKQPLMQRIMDELPPEVRSMVYQRLDYGTAIALRQTCRFFHSEVDPAACTPAHKAAFLAHAEHFARYAAKPRFSHFRRRYACYDCFRILPADAFLDTTLAEDGALDACRTSGSCTTVSSPAQGPLLPGGRWAPKHSDAYERMGNLCVYATTPRRACFACHFRRGGWQPGQHVMLRGVLLRFCGACASFAAGPACLACRRCERCMAAAPRGGCAHEATAVAAPAHEPITDRYVEQMRRGLVHYIALERSHHEHFLDLVFDPELDSMPPYCFHPEPGDDARSMSDIEDNISALRDDGASADGKTPPAPLGPEKLPSMLTANG